MYLVAIAAYVLEPGCSCDNIGFDMSRVVYLTDSLLNLQRVQAGPSACLRWEAARVTTILEGSNESQWRFVPGKINPSDIASRD